MKSALSWESLKTGALSIPCEALCMCSFMWPLILIHVFMGDKAGTREANNFPGLLGRPGGVGIRAHATL